MMKVDLRDQAGITTNALAKLGKNEHVSTQVLEKVCKVLHCEIQDIMEFVVSDCHYYPFRIITTIYHFFSLYYQIRAIRSTRENIKKDTKT